MLLKYLIKNMVYALFALKRYVLKDRNILFQANSTMNYTMFRPLHKKIEEVSKTKIYFRLTPENDYDGYIRLGVPKEQILTHKKADSKIWDSVIVADFYLPNFRWKTRFIQMYHGVAAKSTVYQDEDGISIVGDFRHPPDLIDYDIVLFINETDYYTAKMKGLIKNINSTVVAGMCCIDELIKNSDMRNSITIRDKIIPEQYRDKKVVLYAPTWDETASFRQMGQQILCALSRMDAFIIIKPHPRLFVAKVGNSDYSLMDYLEICFPDCNYLLEKDTPYDVMAISDIMISDFSSITFEYSLLRRPIYLFEKPGNNQKIADIVQYELLKKCCYSFSDEAEFNATFSPDIVLDENKLNYMKLLAEKYFANVGFATDIALAKLIEEKIVIPQ